jgi:hypothetical protein
MDIRMRIDLSAPVREIASDADFEAAMHRSVRLRECAACSIHGARDLNLEFGAPSRMSYATP